MIVQLTNRTIAAIKDQTKQHYPLETCGMIFGTFGSRETKITRIVPAKNILESRISFEIDAEEFMKALEKAQEWQIEHLGFYHSHPGPAYPSPTDVRYMSLWPESLWLVVSSINYEIRVYQTKENDLYNLTIRIK